MQVNIYTASSAYMRTHIPRLAKTNLLQFLICQSSTGRSLSLSLFLSPSLSLSFPLSPPPPTALSLSKHCFT